MEVNEEMLHMEQRIIDSKLLYFYRAQTHDFVAYGTRVSFSSN